MNPDPLASAALRLIASGPNQAHHLPESGGQRITKPVAVMGVRAAAERPPLSVSLPTDQARLWRARRAIAQSSQIRSRSGTAGAVHEASPKIPRNDRRVSGRVGRILARGRCSGAPGRAVTRHNEFGWASTTARHQRVGARLTNGLRPSFFWRLGEPMGERYGEHCWDANGHMLMPLWAQHSSELLDLSGELEKAGVPREYALSVAIGQFVQLLGFMHPKAHEHSYGQQSRLRWNDVEPGLFAGMVAKRQMSIRRAKKLLAAWRTSSLVCPQVGFCMEHRFYGKTPGSAPKRLQRSSISPRLRFEILTRDGFRCRYCGRGEADAVVLHLDHVRPVADGGASTIDNLVAACQECNSGKAARPIPASVNPLRRPS